MRRHSREHPQKDELERFKTEFKARQEGRMQGSIRGKRVSPQIENPNDLFRFPELKFNKRVDRSPSSPTRIVILKPAGEEFWPWSPGISEREAERERLKSGVKSKRKEITEASISSVFCKPRNIGARKSTGSTEIKAGLFRHEAIFSRVPMMEQENSEKTHEPAIEVKKPKKDFLNLKGRIQNLRRALILGGKLFGRKNPVKDDPSEMESTELLGKDNFTEVAPSPASIQWKPCFSSPVTPLETPFNDDLPLEVQDKSSSDNSEIQEHSDETNYLRQILVAAGFYNQPLNLILALCYSPSEPLAAWVFNTVERDYTSIPEKGHENKSSTRRMLFHLLNEQVLGLITASEFSSMKSRPLRSGGELTKCLLEQVERCLGFIKGQSPSLDNLMSDDLRVYHWIPHKELDDVGEALGRMIMAQLLDEFVDDLC